MLLGWLKFMSVQVGLREVGCQGGMDGMLKLSSFDDLGEEALRDSLAIERQCSKDNYAYWEDSGGCGKGGRGGGSCRTYGFIRAQMKIHPPSIYPPFLLYLLLTISKNTAACIPWTLKAQVSSQTHAFAIGQQKSASADFLKWSSGMMVSNRAAAAKFGHCSLPGLIQAPDFTST